MAETRTADDFDGPSFGFGMFLVTGLLVVALVIYTGCAHSDGFGSAAFRQGVVTAVNPVAHSLDLTSCYRTADTCAHHRVWLCPAKWEQFPVGSYFDERAEIRGLYGSCKRGDGS